ncbi:MAG: adenine-specific DNA methylase [Nanoarchaeota archaeon]
MIINRIWAMPNLETFKVKPIKEFVLKYLKDRALSIDPFARNQKLACITNDLNPKTAAQYHLDVLDFCKLLKEKEIKADICLFDPPFTPSQIKMCYESIGMKNTSYNCQRVGRWSEEKEILKDILLPGGIFLHFGIHSNGMGINRGFEILEILLVAHGSAHSDTICMAERKL